MGLNRFLTGIFSFLFITSCLLLAAQSGQESLADAARRIREEKNNKAAEKSNAPQATASPNSQIPNKQPVFNAGELWQDTFDLAEEAMQQEEYVTAEDLYRKAAAAAEKTNLSAAMIAYSYDGLGSAFRRQRKYAEAESAYRTALQTWGKAAGDNEEKAARSKAGLGITLVGLARYADAEQLLMESVNTYHQHPEASLCARSMPLDGLARLYRSTHEYSKGERVYTETFALMTGNNGTPCGNFVALLDDLASLYADDNQWEKVEKVRQGAISLALKMEGQQSELYGDTVFALAQTLMKQSHFDEAAATSAKAAAVFRDCDPPASGKLAQSLEFQELNLQLAGKPEQAKQIHAATTAAAVNSHQTGEASDAMKMVRLRSMEAHAAGNVQEEERLIAQEVQESKKLGAFYQMVALNDSAAFHREHEKTAEAEAELKQVLQLSIASTGASSASTAEAHHELGRFYRYYQRLPEAEQSYEAALSLLGPQDVETLKLVLPSLAAIYVTEGKLDRAEPLYARMLKNADDSHDIEGISGALQYLAVIYQKTNRMAEAEAALMRSMNNAELLPKPMNRIWGFAALSMAKFYSDNGKRLQAEQLYVKVIAFMEKEFDANSPFLRLPLEKLIAVLKSRGQSTEAAKYQARCDQLPPMPPMPPGMPGM
jgi:tetratricopeptide (TPR) repeat protein